jgi:hypothetical protein
VAPAGTRCAEALLVALPVEGADGTDCPPPEVGAGGRPSGALGVVGAGVASPPSLLAVGDGAGADTGTDELATGPGGSEDAGAVIASQSSFVGRVKL